MQRQDNRNAARAGESYSRSAVIEVIRRLRNRGRGRTAVHPERTGATPQQKPDSGSRASRRPGQVSIASPCGTDLRCLSIVARFDDYESAQRAVDQLSDDGFPVEKPPSGRAGVRSSGTWLRPGPGAGATSVPSARWPRPTTT
jgi:hypothetical protein